MSEAQAQEVKEFKNNDELFYHIPKGIFAPEFDFDEIPYHTFRPQGESLSVSWSEYCKTAVEFLTIAGKTPKTHGVGHFVVEDILDIKLLELKHTPSKRNLSHCGIYNIPTSPQEPFNEMRMKLKRIFKYWDIRPIHEAK